MNLALWLERAGSSHGDRPALGLGSRVIRHYGEVAQRTARLAASLRHRFLLQPGERVAIAAKNCPDYLELMFGIWHAGLAAVPANAKLHGRELGYVLQHSGARVCFASSELGDEIATHAPTTLEHLIAICSAEYEELFTADPIKSWPCQSNRSRRIIDPLKFYAEHPPQRNRREAPRYMSAAVDIARLILAGGESEVRAQSVIDESGRVR
jgi:acyl-CoA synthetase (AMP-forming)/AMP-acid ligase II